MSTNVIQKEFSQIQSYLSCNRFVNPWMQVDYVRSMREYYGNSVWMIEHRHGEEQIATGLIFVEEKNGRTIAFSGGRFGFLGFEILQDQRCNYECINEVFSILIDIKFDAVSLRWDSNTEMEISSLRAASNFKEKYKKVVRQYFVTNVNESIFEGELVFPRAKKRSNLTRNLAKSMQVGFASRTTTNLDEIEIWFENCHRKRMRELDSTGWEWAFFRNLAASRNTVMFLVLLEDKIVGGCFCIKSDSELELIMMSSPGEYLERGVNYFLTYHIYKWAETNAILNINWQGSNPPSGGVAKFKLDWNAHKQDVVLHCIKESSLSDAVIREDYPDRYVFPFLEGMERA